MLVDIHLMYPWWKKKRKRKKDALLWERLMLSQHLGRSKMGFVFRVVHVMRNVLYCSWLHLPCFGIASVKSELLSCAE